MWKMAVAMVVSMLVTECIVECVDDTLNHGVSEEVVDPNCGLHMSCTSSFANFGAYTDQQDQSMHCTTLLHGILPCVLLLCFC